MNSSVLTIVTQMMVMAIVLSVVMLFIGIGVVVILHMCVVGRAVGGGLRTIEGGEGDMCGDVDRGLSTDELETLPCYEFEECSERSGGVDCAVCLESFKDGDKCRLLTICRHSFHADCIDTWMRKSSMCPICRTTAICREVEVASKVERRGVMYAVGLGLNANQAVLAGFTASSPPSF